MHTLHHHTALTRALPENSATLLGYCSYPPLSSIDAPLPYRLLYKHQGHCTGHAPHLLETIFHAASTPPLARHTTVIMWLHHISLIADKNACKIARQSMLCQLHQWRILYFPWGLRCHPKILLPPSSVVMCGRPVLSIHHLMLRDCVMLIALGQKLRSTPY